MTYSASCFVVGLFATLFIMRSTMGHGHLSADHDLRGPQKFHACPVPRVGGAGVMVAVVVGVVIAQVNGSPEVRSLGLLIACSPPAFAAGITEDLTKSVSPRRRLFATAIAAGLAIWLPGAVVPRTDVSGIAGARARKSSQLRIARVIALMTVLFTVRSTMRSLKCRGCPTWLISPPMT